MEKVKKKMSPSLLAFSLLLTTYCLLLTSTARAGLFDDLKKMDWEKIKETTEKVKRVLPVGLKEEIALGEEIAARIKQKYGVYHNEDVRRYVSLVGEAVALESKRVDGKKIRYHFSILDSDSINAFSCPGGYIFVSKGLLKKVENEAQLAGILGHEIAHVTQKHVVKAIQKANIVALSAEEALKDKDSKEFKKIVDFGTNLIFNGLSKEDEFEADQVGTKWAYKIGYDPGGLRDFLKTLKGLSSKESSNLALLFKTHPELNKRISQLNEHILNSKMEVSGCPTLAWRYKKRMVSLK
ncbi:M48 family metalloprotease [bacterium]|nr:M48 family metalloprotease [bacterium]